MNSGKKDRIDRLAASAAPASGTAADAPTGTATDTIDRGTVADASRVAGGEGVSLFASAWGRLRRNPLFLVGAAITISFVVLALLSPWIAPHDPSAQLLYSEIRQQTNPIPAARPGFRRAAWRAAPRSPGSWT